MTAFDDRMRVPVHISTWIDVNNEIIGTLESVSKVNTPAKVSYTPGTSGTLGKFTITAPWVTGALKKIGGDSTAAVGQDAIRYASNSLKSDNSASSKTKTLTNLRSLESKIRAQLKDIESLFSQSAQEQPYAYPFENELERLLAKMTAAYYGLKNICEPYGKDDPDCINIRNTFIQLINQADVLKMTLLQKSIEQQFSYPFDREYSQIHKMLDSLVSIKPGPLVYDQVKYQFVSISPEAEPSTPAAAAEPPQQSYAQLIKNYTWYASAAAVSVVATSYKSTKIWLQKDHESVIEGLFLLRSKIIRFSTIAYYCTKNNPIEINGTISKLRNMLALIYQVKSSLATITDYYTATHRVSRAIQLIKIDKIEETVTHTCNVLESKTHVPSNKVIQQEVDPQNIEYVETELSS